MKHILMTAVVLAVAQALAQLPPPGAYVQSGLVAHWDGIDNQATGVHDSTATSSWKDVTHAYEMSLTDVRMLPNGYEFPYRKIDGVQWNGRGVVSGDVYRAFCNVPDQCRTLEMLVQFPTGPTSSSGWAKRTAANLRYALTGLGYIKDNNDNQWRIAAGPYWGGDNCAMDLTEQMTNTFSVLSWYDKSASKARYQIYSNGVDAVSESTDRGIGEYKCECFVFGAQRPDGSFGLDGSILSIRLYDRNLTELEMAYNAALDSARFLGGALPPGLIVGSSKWNIGSPVPAYGNTPDFVPGSDVSFSIETDGDRMVVDGGRRARYVSVTIIDGNTTETVTDTSFTRRLDSASPLIIWNFEDYQFLVEAESKDSVGGRVSVDGAEPSVSQSVWVDAGATVTVAASTTVSRCSFVKWEGNLDGVVNSSVSSIEMKIDTPRAVQAYFSTTVMPDESYPEGYFFITGGWRPAQELVPAPLAGNADGLETRYKIPTPSEPIPFSSTLPGILLLFR